MSEISFLYPKTLDQAVAALASPSARVIAGGTATAHEAGANKLWVEINHLGLNSLESSATELRLGAGLPLTALCDGWLPQDKDLRLISEAVRETATQPLRNMISLGGNLMHQCYWSDLPVVALALGARVALRQHQRGAFEMSCADLFKAHPSKSLPQGSLLTELIIPRSLTSRGVAYRRFRTTQTENPLLSVAVVLDLGPKREILDLRVVLGALGPRPVRALALEAAIKGRQPSEELFRAALERWEAKAEIKIMPNFRMSQAHRARVMRPVIRRALIEALENVQDSEAEQGLKQSYTPSWSLEPQPGVLSFLLNGQPVSWRVEPEGILLDVLRDQGYKGVKQGCREAHCGACTILLDGRPVLSCSLRAGQVEGRRVETIEGLGSVDAPHPLQRNLVDAGGVQCGFCTPGVLMSAKALLEENPKPKRREIARALDGNLCRCTGYVKIIDGVERAAQEMGAEG